MASKAINDFGNLYPQYFFPHIESDRYLNWQQYKKIFKGANEATLINHWLQITGTKPQMTVPNELQTILDNL